MTSTNPFLLADFYKIGHRVQYPPRTEYVYSTWIPRKSFIPGVVSVVAFGFQRFIKRYLMDYFTEHFFSQDIEKVLDEYSSLVSATLGSQHASTDHLRELHALGYLPLRIRAVPEGTIVPLRVPTLTIENTDPRCFWLVNFVETLFSAEVWQPTTSATIAHEYRKLLEQWALRTNPEGADFVTFQGHDFSMRGMSSVEAAQGSGLGHLLSFSGTDTIPAIVEAVSYYGADVLKEIVGTSIPATEHSVMCAGGKDGELETYRRLVQDVYPAGLVSIVSDTWDLWHVVTETLGVQLRSSILARDGKVVVRPDSGDPVDIMCGTYNPFFAAFGQGDRNALSPTQKGVVELLWDAFGGTLSSTGHKVLDSHVGTIYGDSITLDRARNICERLDAKGFASTNVVFGIGSYTYQHQTRDTFGQAMKATWVQIDGHEHNIFKDPITDDGTKKSLTGRVVVSCNSEGEIFAIDGLTRRQQREYEENGPSLLEDVFVDGVLVRDETLSQIRARLNTRT